MTTARAYTAQRTSIANGVTDAPRMEDPFRTDSISRQSSSAPPQDPFSDGRATDLNVSSSPHQARRTIEAHLAETDRRLEDAGRLGNTLVYQRHELAEKLKEVDKCQNDSELPPSLRKSLAEIEKEYNEVGHETARALLVARSRSVDADNQPADSSPAVYSSQAHASPSKVSVPSRKQRTQPGSRAGDIQFAADISSSLLVQVRELQSALADRDELLKTATMERAGLEREVGGFAHRLRVLDESEQRYKDENWNLETQTHELMASSREAIEREKKLNAGLAAALAEKNRIESELDEVRVSHSKLSDDHAAALKFHDSELHSMRRNLDLADNERDSLQKRLDELASQNQELANGIAHRSRDRDDMTARAPSLDPLNQANDTITPENSPPPSPIKATPRHGALESETLRSSLHHAQRMIQNLKGNIHREKTEKFELKRMLQDARDEIEQRRTDSGTMGSGSRRHKVKPEHFKKPTRPDMLGGTRRIRTDVEVDEPEWEDRVGEGSPSQAIASRGVATARPTPAEDGTDASDAYQTATDVEAAFETANERDTTESEDFQTGAESLAGDSTDESTETETERRENRKETIRASKPVTRGTVAGNRASYLSTASTSADEDEDEADTLQTFSSQPLRYRLKLGRGSSARRLFGQGEITPRHSLAGARDSPVSLGSSPPTTERSLFAELGDMNGGGSEFSTPGRASILSSRSTPAAVHMSDRRQRSSAASGHGPVVKSTAMVDSATMTEPWEPAGNQPSTPAPVSSNVLRSYSYRGHDLSPVSPSDFPLPPSMTNSPTKSEMQVTPLRSIQESPIRAVQNSITPPKTIWDEEHEQEVAAHDEKAIFPSSPASGLSRTTTTEPRELESSGNPVTVGPPHIPSFSFSPIITQETFPIEPVTTATPSSTASSSINGDQRHTTTQTAVAGAASLGLLGSVGTTLGLSTAKRPESPASSQDKATEEDDIDSEGRFGLRLQSGGRSGHADQEPTPASPAVISTTNQGSQTELTAEEIEDVLRKLASKTSNEAASSESLASRPIVTEVEPQPSTQNRTPVVDTNVASISPLRRLGISTCEQLSNTAQHPPLPLDHKTAITKAKGRLSTSGTESSPAASTAVSGLMGPPVAPASAYRRPRTPADQSVTSPTRASITPRPSHRDRVRTGSQMSRRSSVSSFASELDERFNIRNNGLPVNRSFQAGPGTDPRMIQAITQTMIGEFLWKYTRKPGRPAEMSSTRHRRYFWVHPYTRTLYWSEQDPQTAGGKELKAKSVAIESVGVVLDDNHHPPGLHNKSLEVVTPGRRIRFTAGTSNRHETWFNALSYLLMRGQEDTPGNGDGGAMDGGLTSADVDEFNPTLYPRNSRLARGTTSRASLSSYQSHATRGTTHSRASNSRPGLHQTSGTLSRASSSALANNAAQASSAIGEGRYGTNGATDTIRRGSVSRLSNMFRPSSFRDSWSISHRRSARNSEHIGAGGSGTSLVGEGGDDGVGGGGDRRSRTRDSAEEVRRELSRQGREGAGKLENVRACCDGKHDVTDLANSHHPHYSHHHHHHHHHSTSTITQRNISRQRSRDRLAASISSRRV